MICASRIISLLYIHSFQYCVNLTTISFCFRINSSRVQKLWDTLISHCKILHSIESSVEVS